MKINNKKIDYYARHLILPEFGEKKQEVIFNSHITFVGMGGINSPALIYLIRMGIKNITIIDHDKVQSSNLNRQIIYSYKDIGKNKIISAKKYIKKMNPDVNLTCFNKKLNKKNCSQLILNTNLVIDGTDNWETMLNINDYCVNKNIPLLNASVLGYDGNFAIFENSKKNHLCFRCIFPNEKKINIPRCETVGVLGTTAGIIGLLSAHKIINFLKLKKIKSNKMTFFFGKNLTFKDITINSNPKCKLTKLL